MSKYRAIIAVPTLVDLEYANNLKAGAAAAWAVKKSYPEVGGHQSKLLELIGPSDEIDEWAAVKKAELKARETVFEPIQGPPDDPAPLLA